jgi:heme A synthase
MPGFVKIFDQVLEEQRGIYTDKEWELLTDESFKPPSNATGTYREYVYTVMNYYAAKASLKQEKAMTRLTWVLVAVAFVQVVVAIIQIVIPTI